MIKLSKARKILPRRQEVPEEAFISVDELKGMYGKGNRDGALPIDTVSFCWSSPAHPDPKGEHLATVAAALKREMPKYKKMGFSDMGVFWDWLSLHQKDPQFVDLVLWWPRLC